MTPRLIATLSIVLLLVAGGWGLTQLARVTPGPSGLGSAGSDAPPGGRLAIPLDAGLVVVQLPEFRETTLVVPDRGASVISASWFPTGDRIAYGYFYRKPGDTTTSAEIFQIGAEGGDPQLLVERDAPGTQIDQPTWSPDGQRLYFSVLKQEGARFINRVEVMDMSTRVRTVVTEGYAPTVSRDGRWLAFLRDSRIGQELWLAATDGSPARQLVMASRFTAITSPRFTADSRAVTFAGAQPAGTAQLPADAPSRPFWEPPSALAHGDPFDIWNVPLDGGEPSRLATLGDDEPALAWSPDGGALLVYAPGGIYRVDRGATAARRVSDRGGYGAFGWVP